MDVTTYLSFLAVAQAGRLLRFETAGRGSSGVTALHRHWRQR